MPEELLEPDRLVPMLERDRLVPTFERDLLELGEVTLFQNDCFLDLLVEDLVAFVFTLLLFLVLRVIPDVLLELRAVLPLEVAVREPFWADVRVLRTELDLEVEEALEPRGL